MVAHTLLLLGLLPSCRPIGSTPVYLPDTGDSVPVGNPDSTGNADSVETIGGDSEDTEPQDTSILPDPGADAPPHDYMPETPDVVVDCTGAGDYRTIQSAIRDSVSGTKIGLAPCVYEEEINFLGKTLDIFSLEGAEVTTIQSDGSGAVVNARRGEGPGTRLAGVTLTGGGGNYGSALYINYSVLALDHVVMTGNNGAKAVIAAEGVALALTDVGMKDNSVTTDGSLILIDNGSLILQRTELDCGAAPMALYVHNSSLVLDSQITCPDAESAVVVDGGELHMRRSRVEGKTSAITAKDRDDTRNERLWLYQSEFVGQGKAVTASYMHIKAEHDVFWGSEAGLSLSNCHDDAYVENSAILGGTCPLTNSGGALASNWNAFGEGTACTVATNGAVTGDPLFADAPTDFRLHANSPLVDAGQPDKEDPDATRADIGVYGGKESAGEP